MKVLLISANTETMNLLALPLGAASVAAAVRGAGHDVRLLDLLLQADPQSAIRDAIADFRPDVIGVSVRNIDDQDMARPQFLLGPVREVIAACRSASGAPIVLGGAGYSIFPESALVYLGADMGIPGEGEALFPALLECMRSEAPLSDLPGVCVPGRAVGRGRFAPRLDALPLPEPALWIPPAGRRRDLWVPVQSRRGCPLDCTYCSTSLIEGRGIRRRSSERVVRWLAELREAGARNFTFVDNTFNVPPAYAKELCRGMIQARLDLNLWCIIYPKWVDAELVELMRGAGCRQISFGFESGSDAILQGLNKRFDAEEVRDIAKLFAEAGIERRGFLLLGGPGETRDTVEESLAFADSLGLEGLKITAGLRIYPRTPLAATALAEGLIRPGDDLLSPRFYLAPGLGDWLPARITGYRATRPWVL